LIVFDGTRKKACPPSVKADLMRAGGYFMKKQEANVDVMTTTEAMAYLRVSRKTLLKLVHKGEIPAQKVGKDFRYLKREIDHFLRGRGEINYFK